MILRRHPDGPILTREDIPDVPPEILDPSSVFNPGAVFWQGRYHLMLRVQTRGRRTYLMTASGEDGIHFDVEKRLLRIEGIEALGEQIYHIYDPRLTVLDGRCHVIVAVDTEAGCRLALAVGDPCSSFSFLGLIGEGDSRNGVLFPERIGGRYLCLERPNVSMTTGAKSGETVVLSESDDLRKWRRVGPVFSGRPHYWDELVGAGPPPVKTRDGWLLVYHGIATHFMTSNIYQAGVLLLDLADPSKVLARCRDNILEPRESWELAGQVPNVVFPSGLVVENRDDEGFARPDSPLRLYYGAADTCVGLATGTVAELIAACD